MFRARCENCAIEPIDLFQLAQQSLRFRELSQNRIVRFGESLRDGARQFDQTFAVARSLITRGNLLFFRRFRFAAVISLT